MRTATWSLLFFAGSALARADEVPDLVRRADDAAAHDHFRQALDLYLAADRQRPDDPVILQKIARQYSDLADDRPTASEKLQYVREALAYSERAVSLAPNDPVNVLSLAICHGKMAAWGTVREKISYSCLVKEEADRALALDPNYAWAHDVLGQWNCALASVNVAERFFVRLFYGGLPAASEAEGLAHLERAVQLEPDEPAHHIELGLAYLAAKRSGDARVELARGLALQGSRRFQVEEKTRARAALAALPQSS